MADAIQTIWCERCNEKLNPKKAVWLELSSTDGKYYNAIPEGHDSQGLFSFGTACSKTELKQTQNESNNQQRANLRNIERSNH